MLAADGIAVVLFLLIFILGPLLERIGKAGKRPVEPVPPRHPQKTPARVQQAERRESAAGMVDPDLWKILTGGHLPPQGQTPLPPPEKKRPWDVVYIPPEETEDEESETVEDVNVELKRTSREAVAREHAARHKPVEERSLEVLQPNIISLEQPLPSVTQRHRAFHEKIAQDQPVAVKKRQLSSLQRAFILQEVLGRPKGLDQ